MTDAELIANFKALRIAQKAFFKATYQSEERTKAFNESRKLEIVVDAVLFPEPTTPSLFDDSEAAK